MLGNNEEYVVFHGDCIEHMREMPPESIDFSVFSPPFPSLFAYTSEAADIGNTDDVHHETKIHLSYFFRALRRIIKPGRVAVCHVMQIPGLARNGVAYTEDFRGMCIRLAKRAGFHYQYDWVVRKNPQAQAIRTHSHKLLFVTLERDRAVSCGAYGDYLIKLIAPGENKTPISSKEITREQWIKWAECCWDDIIETDTLNTAEAKSENDTKHICPLQLEVIRRCVLLYSNPGELVFSPFAGIGSEGFMSLGGVSPKTKLSIANPRRFYGCELKPEYHAKALENLAKASRQREERSKTLFDFLAEDSKQGLFSDSRIQDQSYLENVET